MLSELLGASLAMVCVQCPVYLRAPYHHMFSHSTLVLADIPNTPSAVDGFSCRPADFRGLINLFIKMAYGLPRLNRFAIPVQPL